MDARDEALARLGVDRAAHYLVRPDGHVAYRADGTAPVVVSGGWFPGATRP